MRSPYYKKIEKKEPEDPRDFGKAKSEKAEGFQRFSESIMDAFHT